MKAVTVVDHGSGNLLSVTRALERVGATVTLGADANAIVRADRLILPGVGAFEEGMKGLAERGLVDALRAFARSGRPMLGICLGMQMLAEVSEEFGNHEGLGVVPGRVERIPHQDIAGAPLRVPYVNWAELQPSRAWKDSVLDGVPLGTAFYFVHSYRFVAARSADEMAHYVYGGHRVAALVQAGQVIGCQFHPEKSGPGGLALLARFAAG
jgi:glutamine amidotransferase